MKDQPEHTNVFLHAAWRDLVMLNYNVDGKLLLPLVPAGTELDDWQGENYLTVVGFLFLNGRLAGLPNPFHMKFEEVNLRFYVRRRTADGWRRGVVFIRELVPTRLVKWIANSFFDESFEFARMKHGKQIDGHSIETSYEWCFKGTPGRLTVTTVEEPSLLQPGSETEFIAEHYWAYSKRRNGTTVEYRVSHPSWKTSPAIAASLNFDAQALYGTDLSEALAGQPTSAFLAEGSEVDIHTGHSL